MPLAAIVWGVNSQPKLWGGRYVTGKKKMAAECIHSGWGAVIF